MTPNAFDFLSTYADDESLFSALGKLPDEKLCFWLECYGSKLARWRLARDIEKATKFPFDTDSLCWRVSHWVEKLNRGCRWTDLFPKAVYSRMGRV